MLSPSLLLCGALKGGVVHQLLADKEQDAGFHWETAANVKLEVKTAEIQNRGFTISLEARLQIWACCRWCSSVSGGLPPVSLLFRILLAKRIWLLYGAVALGWKVASKRKELKVIWDMFWLCIGFILLVAHEIACMEKKKRVGAWHWSLHRWHKPLCALPSSKRV